MIDKKLLQEYPTRKMQARDGMAITADVWEEAHTAHFQRLRYHSLFNRGEGILAGLEVIASDPPNRSLYIMPGIAIDALGQTIILKEPVSFDIGTKSEGLLHILISYGETPPQPEKNDSSNDSPYYINTEYVIEAQNTIPGTPCIELARILRHGRNDPLTNAQNPKHPIVNEIDLRFRKEVSSPPVQFISAAAILLNAEKNKSEPGKGLQNLVNFFNTNSHSRINLDLEVTTADNLEPYDLIFLSADDEFSLEKEEMGKIYEFVKNKGSLYFEAWPGKKTNTTKAEQSFQELVSSFGIELEEITPEHPIFIEPNFFAKLPEGYNGEEVKFTLNESICFSKAGYISLWAGQNSQGAAARTQIREALEIGANIIHQTIRS